MLSGIVNARLLDDSRGTIDILERATIVSSTVISIDSVVKVLEPRRAR